MERNPFAAMADFRVGAPSRFAMFMARKRALRLAPLTALLLSCCFAVGTADCSREDHPGDPYRPDDPLCEMTVAAPNGLESWIGNTERAITWSAGGCGAFVAIELLWDGSMVSVIADSASNDGSAAWTAAQFEGHSSGYKIRVIDLDSGATDASDAPFEIAGAPSAPDDFFCVSMTGTKESGLSTTDIDNFDWADEACYSSIEMAVYEMSGGDQVWIDDGTYQLSGIRLTGAKSGSEGNYTIVRARNDGKVALAGDGYAVLEAREAASYFEFRGFRIVECNEFPIYIHDDSHHFKIFRTGWNKRTGLISDGSHHGLMEECYAYGGPHRYAFQTSKGAHHIIFRRCVVRWDWSDTNEPVGSFCNYTCDEIHYQNCISIDGIDNRGQDAPYDGLKSYFTANGSPYSTFAGCISLNMQGAAGYFFEGPPGHVDLTDCVAWDHRSDEGDETEIYKPWPFVSTADFGGLTANRMTIGVSDIGDEPVSFDDSNDESFRNSIVFGMELHSGNYAVSGDLDDQDYICYYGNTGGRNFSGEMGPHCLTEVDPFTSGLTSLTGIAPGSLLKTAGENGSQIGAQIETRIGVSGSLHGEAGWDQDTGEPLWPFPYEDQIRADCRQYSQSAGAAYPGSPAIDGTRGFCAQGRTLSTYIAEYIGR